MAPRGTPQKVVRTLSNVIKEATESPDYREQLARIGTKSFWLSPEGLQELMIADQTKFKRVIAEAGIETVD